MPLLGHFHPPLSDRRPWESFHTTWASALADSLNQDVLPEGYIALEQVHAGPANVGGSVVAGFVSVLLAVVLMGSLFPRN